VVSTIGHLWAFAQLKQVKGARHVAVLLAPSFIVRVTLPMVVLNVQGGNSAIAIFK
jgi:hypothetical protein